ncbi:unnamed protein product [Discula destructiva]
MSVDTPASPCPRVLLYSSSDDNALGYEWILMEYMSGVEFETAAPEMPIHHKLHIATTLATWQDELSRQRFPALGSIYFTKSARRVMQDHIAFSLGPGRGQESFSWV